MLTIKLMKAAQTTDAGVGEDANVPRTVFSTKILEAEEVTIYDHRPGELAEVAIVQPSSVLPKHLAFYLAPRGKRPAGFADEVDFYYAAFIENSRGSTTQSVTF